MAINKRKVLDSARRLAQKGNKQKALKEYEKLIVADPRDAKLLLEVGDVHRRWGQNEEAIAKYGKVAAQYRVEGFDARAVAVLKQILALDPKRYGSRIELAELYQRMGLDSDALVAFQAAADGYYQEGRRKEALELLRRMISLDPGNTTSRTKVAELLWQEGLVADAASEFKGAAEELERQGAKEEAEVIYQRLLEIAPDDVETLGALAHGFVEAEHYEQARPLAMRALELAREAENFELLCRIHKQLGETEELAARTRELADLYRERGDDANAREAMQRLPTESLLESVGIGVDLSEQAEPEGDRSGAEDPVQTNSNEVTQDGEDTVPGTTARTDALRKLADEGFILDGKLEWSTTDAEGDESEPISSPVSSGLEASDLDQRLAEVRVYQRYGKIDEARACLDELIESDPHEARVWKQLGHFHADQEEEAAARVAWEKALSLTRETGQEELETELVSQLGGRSSESRTAGESKTEDPFPEASVEFQAPLSSSLPGQDDQSSPGSSERFGQFEPPRGTPETSRGLSAEVESVMTDLFPESESNTRSTLEDLHSDQETGFDPRSEASNFEPDMQMGSELKNLSSDGEIPSPVYSIGSLAQDREGSDQKQSEYSTVNHGDSGGDSADSQGLELEVRVLEGHVHDDVSLPELESLVDEVEEFGDGQGVEDDSQVEVEFEIDLAGMSSSFNRPTSRETEEFLPDHDDGYESKTEVETSSEEIVDTVSAELPVRPVEPLESDASGRRITLELNSGMIHGSREDLEEAEFYRGQGMDTEADAIYARLESEHGEGSGESSGEDTTEINRADSAPSVPWTDASSETSDWADTQQAAGQLAISDDLEAILDEVSPGSKIERQLQGMPSAPVGSDASMSANEPGVASPGLLQTHDQEGAKVEETFEQGDFDLAAELADVFDAEESGSRVGAFGDTTLGEGIRSIFSDFKRGVDSTLGDGDGETRFDLAIAYREMGLLEDAAREFQVCLDSPPRRLESLHMLGLCALELDRPRDASNHLEQALALEGLNSEQEAALCFDLGRIEGMLGRTEKSREYFERVGRIDSSFPGLESALAGLVTAGVAAGAVPEQGYESFDELFDEDAQERSLPLRLRAREGGDDSRETPLARSRSAERRGPSRSPRRKRISFV